MTSCADLEEHIPAHADGELPADLRATTEAHLTSCRACRTQYERWQALRRCTQRALADEAVPVGLEARVRTGLSKPERSRIRRVIPLFGMGLAAAAVVILAVAVRSPSSENAVSLSAADFARTYLNCAVNHRHDSAKCRLLAPAAAAKALAAKWGFEPLVPDLAAQGYVLDGACACMRVPDVQVIHVYYRSTDNRGQVVSLFSVDRPVRLESATPCTGASGCAHKRVYQMANAQNVTVAKWDENGSSFALCSQMSEASLMKLAQSVSVASRPSRRPAFARSAGR